MSKPSLLIPNYRKSSKEDPVESRKRQKRAVEAWASAHDDVELADEVWEPGVSGSKPWQERGLGAAIAACERGEAAGIIVESTDRLSRENGAQTGEMWERLERSAIRLVAVSDGIDTANGDHELNFSMRAALAREQWKQFKRRSEASKRAAIERGVHFTSRTPVGYAKAWDAAGRALPLVLDEPRAAAVRTAFERRAVGVGAGTIADELDAAFPPPSEGGHWTKTTVERILKNRVYLGEARNGEYVKPGAHPAIVDEVLFDTVQALRRRVEPRKAPAESTTLLRDVVRCKACGYAMVKTALGETVVYRCRGKSAAGKCPARATIVSARLDDFVLDAVLDHFEEDDEVGSRETARAELAELRETIADVRARKTTFGDSRLVHSLGLDVVVAELATIDAELVELEAKRVELEGRASEYDFDVANMREVAKSFGVEERRQLIRRVVDAVVVDRVANRGSNRAPVDERVEIVWKRDGVPFARPLRGRKRPVVAAGIAAA